MPDFDAQILGLAELESALMELSDRGVKNALRTGLRAGAAVVRDEARARVRKRSGKLRRAIRTRERADDQGWMRFAVEVPRSAFYGKFGEYGTSKMAAWPFLRPAAEVKTEAAASRMRDRLAEAIEAEMRKARR
ncbi:HK97-gp10 family putative phage morphogenesis protein [Pseudoxanthomonas winnipegensis]|uniref:HK97 gp10 family phage protein n=1 Tax=Pseudoxanthomonas winnipegensis TaxID=2480810 RepID=A0A4Q8LAA0_9GAMM|nr:HK97-gp10 family putative phage morphogenesis protein [Pseudoxanthomonas winnipegensis]RZZ81400.1 hypothetical protein EA663_20465 [Pseudoxanthomonas winnipegensis]TAA25395.1 hypothetical protein EA660_08005 [Pseudoxanthomonas winnipegensis]